MVTKIYWVIVAGSPDVETGAIDLAIGRFNDKRGRWMKIDLTGRPARTVCGVRGSGVWRGAPIAWLKLEPQTGRTHQLRVHCASQGWPILGDAIYGERAETPLQLLARKVVVPRTKAKRSVESRCRPRRTCWRRSPPAPSPEIRHAPRRSRQLPP